MEQGCDYEDYGLVFATETGTPLLWRNLGRRHLKPLLTAVGIPTDGFSLYSLRHTHCALRLMNSDNVFVIAADIGTSVAMISSTYGRVPEQSHRHPAIDCSAPLRHVIVGTRTLFAHQKQRAATSITEALPYLVDSSGEPSRTRTCDPLVKSQLLYQLSYRPIYMHRARVGVLIFKRGKVRRAFYRTRR
jgi:hypothetical protein